MSKYLLLFLGILLSCRFGSASAAGQAEHVVVIVWDGMRPDFVTPQYTPTLYELAQRGTFFMRNHSAYVTTTEVNGTALATGMHPDHSGIIANTEYQPEFNWLGSYGTEALDVVRRGDMASGGHYLQTPTVAELLHAAGFPTMIAGAKPIALLHDRAPKKVSQAEKDSVTLFRGLTLPRSVQETLVNARDIGPFPGSTNTAGSEFGGRGGGGRSGRNADSGNAGLPASTNAFAAMPPFSGGACPGANASGNTTDAWTTKALVRGLWRRGVPKYSLLWLSEPDAAQHGSGVGSDPAIKALESSDDQLAAVLKALEEKNALETTDIFVVSDHGFSTVGKGSDILGSLKKLKFKAGRQFENPEAGDILVDNLGGSTFFYVFEHDEQVIRRLVSYLQGTDFAGVIFSAVKLPGTFPLSDAHVAASKGAPDLVVSMRWNTNDNDYGAPGMLTVPDGRPGGGVHGSLSRFDLHNTLIVAGPDFKKGFTSLIPSGNIDVAPTVLSILGVSPPEPMDGRVLVEALAKEEQAPVRPAEETIEAMADLGFLRWNQYLKVIRVGYTVYYEEGNGRCRLSSEPVAK
jgi:arylsulfatase A-like enzyme